ncbi:MAG: M3 family oligoendopeptidase [Planctomycetaceae bacterium]|nr:M3 family oligoendopeptidase [Planctomycetaceae bacterium]
MPTHTRYALTWDLDSLYPHPERAEFQTVLERYKSDLTQLAADSETLPALSGSGATAWGAFVERLADLLARSEDLHSFVGCHAAADAENKLFQRLEGQLSALGPIRQQVLTNVELALKQVSEAELPAILAADARLQEVAFFLEESRRIAALRLPKDQELLAAELAVDAIHAWGRLYDRLSGEVRVEVMEKGEVVRKSPSQVTFDSSERSVRQNNFYAAGKAWSEIADTCAEALNHISGFRLSKYRRLGLKDHLDAPLRNNRMQRETLEAMWSAVSARRPVLLKYFAAKARLLGLERLSWYDTLAPLPSSSLSKSDSAAVTLTYDTACDLVIKTFSEFSSELGDFARMSIADRWIEVENRSGKRQGGFCTGLPTKKQSRIFMTYTNTADSMSTLAHELGHAYHSYVLRDQPILLQDYPSNLAETASTFAEAVLGERRLADAASADQQRAILDHMLSDSVAFLMNIHARFVFEHNFHIERRDGELSAERFSELMLAAQRETYCDGLDADGWYPQFWVSKLHFYITGNPFYNFPYTFGYLLSQGVYAHAKTAGPGFAEQYRQLLIATGCQTAEEAISSTLGYDLTKPDFWNKSLDIVDQRVAQFVSLCEG